MTPTQRCFAVALALASALVVVARSSRADEPAVPAARQAPLADDVPPRLVRPAPPPVQQPAAESDESGDDTVLGARLAHGGYGRHVRLAIGGSYLFIGGTDVTGFTATRLSGPAALLALRFGEF